MSDSSFRQLALEEPGLNMDEQGIPFDTIPYTEQGTIDFELMKLNFLEDLFGRFHMAKDQNTGSVNASSQLISLAKLGNNGFIAKAKKEMGPEGDLFDRFLSFIWSNYLAKIDTNVKVVNFANSQGNFEIYKEIHAKIKEAKKARDIRYWPHKTSEVEEDF